MVAHHLTTENEEAKVINTAKTLAIAQVRTTAELDALVKTLREQVPATVVAATQQRTVRCGTRARDRD